jgi:hypothetical protein
MWALEFAFPRGMMPSRSDLIHSQPLQNTHRLPSTSRIAATVITW